MNAASMVIPSRLPPRAESAERRHLRGALAGVRGAAILESGPGFGELGRFSIYAALPRATFHVIDGRWELSSNWPGRRPDRSLLPFEALRQLLNETKSGLPGSDTVFQGGWMGYVGYDIAPLLERLPRRHARTSNLPDLSLSYYDTFSIHDARHDSIAYLAVDRFGEGEASRQRRLDRFRAVAERTIEQDPGEPTVTDAPISDFTPDEYCCAVERILEYIRAGDIFQANFAHCFRAPFVGRPEHLFRRCTEHNPAPFTALLRTGHGDIISTSPERFYLLEPDGRVETRPIKGTRQRGQDAICDLLLRDELETSDKDLAELTMIVDLERNDLGRVCDYGTVRVSRHAEVESFSNVHHLVSTIEGRLRHRCDAIDLLRAMFPGGSITGAPKIRAMQIIDELERCRRGIYTGAIGYFSDHGRCDFNIAIRTLVLQNGEASYHVGGGIVAESDPLSEYRETLTKGRRLREALLAEGGS